MYSSNRKLSIILILMLAIISFSVNAFAAGKPHVLVDMKSGKILSQNDANDRWYPASLTKLMTAYVTFRAIHAREIDAGSPVIISTASTRQPPSKMGYKQGVKLRVDTAVKIILVKSANDVSYALAEAVAGSLQGFVTRMNKEAKRLGMVNTHFTNSNGLHNKKQYSSARDMAVLTSHILKEYPQYANIFKAVGIKTAKKTHYTYNLLLERYQGANGMKTGFVCASGYNMVASAKRGERFLVAVVMGLSSQTERAVEAAKLLNSGFANHMAPTGDFLQTPAKKGANPINMRPKICSEAARKARYDPGAGQANIDHPALQRKVPSSNVLAIKTGNIDGRPSKGAEQAKLKAFLGNVKRIPIPTPRPSDVLLPVGKIRTNELKIQGTGVN